MPETIQLTVMRVRFHNRESGFTVAVGVRDGSAEEITFVGTCVAPDPGDPLAVTGEWRQDAKWGRQFVAESVMPIVPTTEEEIREYLADGFVDGIGPKLAERLVDRFGADLFRILDEEPQRLREVRGIGPKTLQDITASWKTARGARDLMVFLASFDIGGARAYRIHQQYGVRAESLIRENPYRLAREIRGIGFATADSIAQRLGHDRRSPFRLASGIWQVIDDAREQQGHCGIPIDEASARAAKLLAVERELVDATIETLIADGVVIEEKAMLFEPWLYAAESRIAATLARLADEAPPWSDLDPDEAIQVAEEESGIVLDATQRSAVALAIGSGAVAITGGPGVGKTTLVRALLAVFRSADLRVALAAPTGRAAKRLAESTGGFAETIHRMLAMSPESGRFQRNEENPLEADVVIIDECSMVDVPLLDAVLSALPPGAAIVLVGDADQLPSIGPGQVLHDILRSGRVPSIRLTEIHRQAEGSHIVLNAHRINRGEAPRFGKDVADMFLFPAATPERAVRHVVELVTARIPRKFGFRPRDIQVLAPMRGGTCGVNALNAALQEALNAPSGHTARVERPNSVVFCRGDKVMQTENNYDKEVFNGDIGVIAAIDVKEKTFTVDFGGDLIVDYAFGEADQLTLAYATTIHKSQGSEYDAVVIALLPQHSIMLRRNLLYTAVTRGRRLVVIAGDERSIDKAVRTGQGGERWTRLADCLGTAPRAT